MNRILLFLVLLTIFISCIEKKHQNVIKSTSVNLDKKEEFHNWLRTTGFSLKKINDSSKNKAFELWAYSDQLKPIDSTFNWYPSIDSSYYLITNYNDERKTISDSSDYVRLRFLEKRTEEVYLGIGFPDATDTLNLDFYWYDENTIYFITKYGENSQLTKLKMHIDSIWTSGIIND